MPRPNALILMLCGFVIGAAFFAIALGADSRRLPANLFVIDDFDGDIQNRLGGYRNTFVRSPSVAQMRRVVGVGHRDENAVSLAAERQSAVRLCD